MPGSAGSTPKARAGKASVTRLSHKSWIGVSGLGRPKSIDKNTIRTSAMLQDRRKDTNFLILAKITLPSSTAFTIVAKLSSTRIISAVSLATSVPVIPIDIPISAFLIAGASFTPSPVMATISPF